MKKILITGAAGFVGRHLTKRFLDAGDEVTAVDPIVPLTGGIHPDHWPLFNPWKYTRFYYYYEDCRTYFQQYDYSFDYVFHCAAIVGGREMIESNPLAVAQDLSIDAEFLNWCVKTRPKRIVCFSSSAAYPVEYQKKDCHCSLSESMIDFSKDLGMPDMSYGWAKLTLEYLCQLAREKHGLDISVYRPFSGYGEDQHHSYPFPAICRRAFLRQDPLHVWGSGKQIRDFVHIEDICDFVLATMDTLQGPLNLSTGFGTTMKELAQQAAYVVGYEPKIYTTTDKPEGVFARVGNTDRQKSLGLEQSISPLTGVQRMMTYLRSKA